eukprot:scaffold691_cov181-Ochromonas_danica.AAC.38
MASLKRLNYTENLLVNSLQAAQWVHVIAARNAGKDRLVPVLRVQQLPPNARVTIFQQGFPLTSEFFQYQEVTYYYDTTPTTTQQQQQQQQTKSSFHRLSYPIHFTADAIVPGDLISLTSDPAIDVYATEASGKPSISSEEGKVIPCDALLIRGNCVVNEAMLTGESTPKVKESMLSAVSEPGNEIDLTKTTLWSRHTLLGGTLLQQHSNPSTEGSAGNTTTTSKLSNVSDPPDGGCLALVVKTGFATTQGELMRKILFATEGIAATSKETFVFIGVLVLFALVAATWVLYAGLQDSQRNKFRLALHCIMIITSVVPPELPMELSLAITNSLAALVRSMVFCTEPFRISFAGKLNVVCFDKTGTLTKDEMVLKGVAAPQEISLFHPQNTDRNNDNKEEEELDSDLLDTDCATDLVKCIMGCCHDLVHKRAYLRGGQQPLSEKDTNGVLGDPLEIAAFTTSGFTFLSKGLSQSQRHNQFSPHTLHHDEMAVQAMIRQRYPFNSELKRMSSIVTLTQKREDGQDSEISYVFTKGAPEVLKDFLAIVPKDYATVYSKFMKSGKRVLALAYRPVLNKENPQKMVRNEAEKGLHLAGFLVFDCDLKADSKSVIRELQYSQHKTIMITGDSVYTAANVARRLAMVETQKPVLVLTGIEKNGKSLVWRTIDAETELSSPVRDVEDRDFNLSEVSNLALKHTLCVFGPAMDLLPVESLKSVCPHISIFARVSPQQKERIVLSYNESGVFSLMCGDGTNDVGALKAAHVGVSIVNNPKLESKVEQAAAAVISNGTEGKKKSKMSSKDRMARAMLELKAHEEDPTLVKLGDASIASPFTSKRTSVDCVLTIIRQGRCTLVTTIQVYKVLALNCLASAFMMSSLYLKGLKQGDTQMTCSGLVVATLFFFLSQAKPLLDISDCRPPSSVFSQAVTWSILGQFVTHLLSMWVTMQLCEAYAHPDLDHHLLPDGKFSPNLVNTAMFVLSNLMQVNNFWVNYRGPPYMEDLRSNKYFWWLLQAVYAALLIVVGGQFEPLNDLLQLVSLPTRDFQIYFLGILAANTGLAYLIERLCRRME